MKKETWETLTLGEERYFYQFYIRLSIFLPIIHWPCHSLLGEKYFLQVEELFRWPRLNGSPCVRKTWRNHSREERSCNSCPSSLLSVCEFLSINANLATLLGVIADSFADPCVPSLKSLHGRVITLLQLPRFNPVILLFSQPFLLLHVKYKDGRIIGRAAAMQHG